MALARGRFIPDEDAEQIEVVEWLKTLRALYGNKRKILFAHIPNGGKRDIITAVRLKAMGVMAGFPDLGIFVPSQGYPGLFIEMKRLKGGQLSAKQRQWLQDLADAGYKAVVCEGATAAKKVIVEYLGLDPSLMFSLSSDQNNARNICVKRAFNRRRRS
jgi:hypothetical protein